jgi:hypothetical protein
LNDAAAHDLREGPLSTVFHERSQALANAVHLLTGSAHFVEEENRRAHLNLPAHEGRQIDAMGLDVRTNGTGGDTAEAKSGCMLGYLFLLDQAYLPFPRLTGAPADSLEVASIANDSFLRQDFNPLDRDHGGTGGVGVQMQRYHAGWIRPDHALKLCNEPCPRKQI